MASIIKVGLKWRVHVMRHGIRRTKVLATKREAQAWALRCETELDGMKRAGGMFTFAQAADRYMKSVTPEKRSARWEVLRIGAMKRHFGGVLLVEMDQQMIADWRDTRLETVCGSTVQREANILRNLLKVARDEWRWIEHEPFRGVRLPKHNAPRHQMWTWQLIKQVLRAPRSGKTAEVQAAFRIALHTGLRLSEVLAGRYDARRQVMELARTKTGGRVDVPVPRRAVKLLPQAFTVGPNEASTLFAKLTKQLLIEGLTFHDSRAAALTWLSARVDVRTLQRISRHKDANILLNTYFRESAEQIARRI